MDARPLSLNRDEVMVLSDRTANTDRGTEDMPVTAYRLLVKLGALYLELVVPNSTDGTSERAVHVTEAEAWLLRGKIQSGDKMSSDSMFGIKLLRKLYKVLLEFDADAGVFPDADEEGQQMGPREREILKLWAEKEDDDGEKQPA